MNYLFILGRNPEISILEIESYLKRKGISYKITSKTKEYLILTTDNIPETTIQDLGGTVLLAKELNNLNELTFEKNKIQYAVIPFGDDGKETDKSIREVCKQQKVKSMRKHTTTKRLSPSKLHELDHVFVVINKKIFIAQQISSPKKYKERDETRPVFDPVAVTSIRLAKILINLAQAKKQILDPFCGTGTILQEAILMGYEVIGIDKNIQEAKQNLQSLVKSHTRKINLIQGPAENRIHALQKIECVVTEPYMGPYVKKLPLEDQAKQLISELTGLYTEILTELSKVITGRIVIILPRIRTYKKTYNLPISQILRRAGLKNASIPLEYTKKTGKIERVIYILEKT